MVVINHQAVLKPLFLKRKNKMNEKWNELKKNGSEHYKTGGVEPLDLYASGGMLIPFALCSIIKYAFRSRIVREPEVFVSNMNKIIDYAQKLKACIEPNVEQ